MTEEQNPDSSPRLLSKVVKFITSPTTDWSDLGRADSQLDGSASASSLALKEMIERKRRNDFVRNREFDMLRKLRHRQGRGSEGASSSLLNTSVVDSSVNAYERERTLQKIDRIEAQMSRSWVEQEQGHQHDNHPAAADLSVGEDDIVEVDMSDQGFAPTQVEAPGSMAQAHQPTEAMGLGRAEAPAEEAEAGSVPMLDLNFDRSGLPIEPLSQWGAQSETAPLSSPTQLPDVRVVPTLTQALEPLPSEPPAVPETPPVLEEPVELLMSPALEDVAIRFANDDMAGAEVNLMQALEQGEHQDDMQAWLALFDLYRAANLPDRFDGAAMAFVSRFGRSAPQWQLAASGPDSMHAPLSEATGGPVVGGSGAAQVHWTAPATLGVQSLAALRATLSRHPVPPWRIDWRRVKKVDPLALPGLLQMLQSWASDPGAGLRFLGAEALLQVLAEESPIEQREADPQWWGARLALLRLMGEGDEFDLVALNYCVTYEVSPPAWEEPRCSYAALDESGLSVPPANGPESELDSRPPDTQISSFGLPSSTELVRHALEGEILGSALPALEGLTLAGDTRTIELNCRHVRRVDFAAAGDLLNWVIEQQGQGREVVFRNVNRLVAAFFSVIGIADVARVMQRTD